MEKDLIQMLSSMYTLLNDYKDTKSKLEQCNPAHQLKWQQHSLHLLHIKKKLTNYFNYFHLRINKPGTHMICEIGQEKFECNFCSLSKNEAIKIMEALAMSQGQELKVLEISEISSFIKAI